MKFSFIDRRYGTHRGLIRAGLANLIWFFGPYRKYGVVDWTQVRRLVFICHGNICRSPFAHRLYEKMEDRIPVVSFGLSTSTGAPADEMATLVARKFDVELREHKATDVDEFSILDGDLLLVMEDRHIRALHTLVANKDVQMALLGLWSRPRFALLYDPYKLTADYYATCFGRIANAIIRLREEALENLSVNDATNR
ncbi:MAG: phosphotyrosine protein phosphatase [Alphaproteobacteria bacterium]|nr:phosphotyrosine protein phosphatase [Alphaproteobacteria bacterium]